MKRILFLFFALTLGAFEAAAQQPARFDWLRHFRGRSAKSDGGVWSVLLDNSGNTYSLVRYRGSVSFSTLSTFNADTIIHQALVKLDRHGDILWAAPLVDPAAPPQTGYDATFEVTATALGPANSVYLTGWIYGSLQIGTAAPIVSAIGEQFMARIDSTGQLVWGRAQGTGFTPYTLAVDQTGNAYIGSYFANTATLYNGTTPVVMQQTHRPVTNRWHSSAFCVAFDATGQYRWSKYATDADTLSTTWISSVAVDRQGHVFATGLFTGDVSWDGFAMTAPRDTVRNALWLRLDANTGQAQHYFVIKNGFGSYDPVIAADAQGYSYLSNSYRGRVDLGGRVLRSPSPATPGSYQAASYLARYDPSGVLQWAQPFWGDSSSVETVTFTADPVGKVYVTGSATQHWRRTAHFGNLLLSQNVRHRQFSMMSTFVVAFDQSTGLGQWVTSANAGYSVSQGQQISVNRRGELALLGYWQGQDSLHTEDGLHIVRDAFHSNGGISYAARLLQQYNTITGEVFVDANANDQHDSNESTYPYGAVVETLPDHRCFTSDAAGRYNAFVQLSTHTIAMPYPPLYYVAVPVNATPVMTFTTYGNLSPNHDFALRPIAGQQDVRVNLTAVSRARPGFPVKYRVTYRNLGTVSIATGAVTLVHDARLTYLSTTGAGTHAGTTLSTAYTALAPGQARSFDVLFQVPTTAPLGDTLVTTAAITPLTGDLTPADNTETSRLRVTGSFDPNDIEVNYATLTPQQVAAGEWLEYTIRFQNMGTDTAFSILLRDSLPVSQLNLGTLQLIAASHSCAWSLSPEGVLSVSFTSIRLPHRAVNTVGSLGMVRFRVRPQATLAGGDLIPNRAEIHFDYNAPITTNTALTAIDRPAGLNTAAAASLSGGAWPNPASSQLNVEASLPAVAALHLTLLDAVGRPVRETTAPAARGLVRETLDVRGLAAGLYLLRAQAGAASFTRRIVVK